MTYVYTKRTYNGGVTDVPTIIKVEYVLSSLTKLIKVVDMWDFWLYYVVKWVKSLVQNLR